MKILFAKIRFLLWLLSGRSYYPKKCGINFGPNSIIDKSAVLIGRSRISLARNVQLLPFSRLVCGGMPPYVHHIGSITIGENTLIRENVCIFTYGGAVKIGSNVSINPNVLIQANGGVTIGDDVRIAGNTSIIAGNHIFSSKEKVIWRQGMSTKGIVIQNDVWIGTGVSILDGVTVGHGSIIAAGSVVTKDVRPMSVYAGVPAKYLKER